MPTAWRTSAAITTLRAPTRSMTHRRAPEPQRGHARDCEHRSGRRDREIDDPGEDEEHQPATATGAYRVDSERDDQRHLPAYRRQA